ncbi:hypothetical protein A6J60_013180 [Psychrobacter sp. FDAARGOS_221]|nr:hypothetical protein A6J60_013180 [Psychrobacter sp. FDAARGOS_221]
MTFILTLAVIWLAILIGLIVITSHAADNAKPDYSKSKLILLCVLTIAYLIVTLFLWYAFISAIFDAAASV